MELKVIVFFIFCCLEREIQSRRRRKEQPQKNGRNPQRQEMRCWKDAESTELKHTHREERERERERERTRGCGHRAALEVLFPLFPGGYAHAGLSHSRPVI